MLNEELISKRIEYDKLIDEAKVIWVIIRMLLKSMKLKRFKRKIL